MPDEQETYMNEGRRDKHDILMQILSLLRHNRFVRKTSLMSQLGLSSLQLRIYLGFLEGNKLISLSEEGISISEMGLDHFEKCSKCPMFERSNAIWKFRSRPEVTLKSEEEQAASCELLS